MKEKKKTVLLLAVLILLLVPSVGLLVSFVRMSIIRENRYYGEHKLESARELIESAESARTQAEQWLRKDLTKNANLMAYLLQSYVRDGIYSGPRLFENGMVAEISGEEVILPEELPPGFITITPGLIRDSLELTGDRLPRTTIRRSKIQTDPADSGTDPADSGTDPADSGTDQAGSGTDQAGSGTDQAGSGTDQAGSGTDQGTGSDADAGTGTDEENVILTAGSITDNTYYIDWTLEEQAQKYVKAHADTDEVIATAEESCSAALLLVSTSDPALPLRAASSVFPGVTNAGQLGISSSDIEGKEKEFTIDGQLYEYLYRQGPENMYTIILMLPVSMLIYRGLVRSLLVAAFIYLVIAPVIFWIMCVRRLAFEEKLSPSQISQYHPRRIKSVVRFILLAGCVFIFAVSALIHILGHIQTETVSQKEMLSSLKNRLVKDEQVNREHIVEVETEFCVSLTERIASMIGEDPRLQSAAVLDDLCRMLQFDYMMLFDSEGNETVCSKDYIGFRLSDISGRGTEDFRRLTQGISRIVLEPSEDAISGQIRQLIGVPLPSREGERHSVLVAALEPERTEWSYDALKVNDQLVLATPDQNICFAVNEESTLIEYASDADILHQTAAEAGLPQALLKDSVEDFFTINNKNYYGVSDRNLSLIFFYGIRSHVLSMYAFPYALLAAGIFMLLYLVFTKASMAGFSPAAFESVHGKPEDTGNSTELFVFDSSRNRQSSPRWTFQPVPWSKKLPLQKTRVFIHCISALILLVISLSAFFVRTRGRETNLYAFITRGTWTRGFNVFALCGILLTLVYAYLAVQISRTVLQKISQFTGSRGQTLCRLIFNIIEYLSVLVFLYYALNYIGVNTATILASLGLVSLALTLGAKDLFADIIAGFFIVFQEAYQVGDSVKINDVEGVVQEIGVRSTKLVSRGDNVVIINNSSVSKITNMSRMNSWYAMEFTIPASVSLDHVEEILKKELPRIGKGEPHIVSGPVYKGVEALDRNSLTLCLITECSEKYFNRVKRYVNREIHLLLNREGMTGN